MKLSKAKTNMTTKNKTFSLILLILAVVMASGSRTNAQAVRSPGAKVTKTETMLKEIKAVYKPFQAEGSFIISYNGNVKSEIDVIVVEVGTAIAILADAAAGREIDLTPEKMRKLLEFNSRSDYIKVGISDIGSIRVQSEQKLVLLNPKLFEEILDQVAAGTDEVAKIIGPIKAKAVPIK